MTDKLMPDLVDAIEQRLRDEAVRPSERRSRLPLIALTAAACAPVALVAIMLAGPGGDQQTGPRRADRDDRPLILRTAAVSAPGVVRELERGGTLAAILGPGAQLDEARPVEVFGGTAYVVTGKRGWCLTVPDPSIKLPRNPVRSSGVTCRRTADVYRMGMLLLIGQRVLAVVPRGTRNPTLTSRDGQVRELKPTDQGVVAVENAPAGWLFTLYGRDGSRSALRVQRTRPVVSPAKYARQQKRKTKP